MHRFLFYKKGKILSSVVPFNTVCLEDELSGQMLYSVQCNMDLSLYSADMTDMARKKKSSEMMCVNLELE